MIIFQFIRKIFHRRSALSIEQFRSMIDNRKFREAVEAYKDGLIDPGTSVSDLIGYCYYQLTDYAQAVVYLEKALKSSPDDYYSSFFLGVCYKLLHDPTRASVQFLKCLKRHPDHASEILNHLLPLTADSSDLSKRDQTFEEIKTILSPDDPAFARVLFCQHREAEATNQMLQGVRIRKIYSAQESAQLGNGTFLPIEPPERLRFVHMETSGDDIWLDSCFPYVAQITDADIVSGSSLVFVGQDRVLSDILANAEYGRYADMQYDSWVVARRDDALMVKDFEPEILINEGIMLCGLASNAYGHWTAEFLPKLRFFEKNPRFSEIPIIVDEVMPQSHYDFLAILTSNPIIRLPKGGTMRVKNLFVAPADTFFPLDLVKGHKVPPERQSSLTIGALKYIRDRVNSRMPNSSTRTRRIFLSRRNSQWRRLINEKQIITALERFGFETLYIEDFTFAMQVQIFREAAFIVAPNGSALNNLIFSDPSINVILLGQKGLFNWGSWFGSFMELGYSPQYLAGESVGHTNEKHLDYSVSPAVVIGKVEEMLSV